MNQPLPKFAENGWRRLANGHLQHISGLEFVKVFNGGVEIVETSLPVFIQNLKKEGVDSEMAERLLKKLNQQAEQHFMFLN